VKASVPLDSRIVGPCGIYCGACYAFLREKNACPGCRLLTYPIPDFRLRCKIANCDILNNTDSGFCYDCEKIPCKRLKQLDKRYRTKYNTGLIQNLSFIKEKGMAAFLKLEIEKRTCPDCGSIISIHRDSCTNCNRTLKTKP
jgi:ribosomal protein S27AE